MDLKRNFQAQLINKKLKIDMLLYYHKFSVNVQDVLLLFSRISMMFHEFLEFSCFFSNEFSRFF